MEDRGQGTYRKPRRWKSLLPSLVRIFLAESSRLLDPSSLTIMARIIPLSTTSTYWARRRLSSLLRYVSNLGNGVGGGGEWLVYISVSQFRYHEWHTFVLCRTKTPDSTCQGLDD